jgi:hypothetical protein
MKNTQKRREDVSRDLKKWQLEKLVALPLARRIDQHAVSSLKMARRIFAKLEKVEDSIEILAREIARQAKREK